jgi:hypothetical protein
MKGDDSGRLGIDKPAPGSRLAKAGRAEQHPREQRGEAEAERGPWGGDLQNSTTPGSAE